MVTGNAFQSLAACNKNVEPKQLVPDGWVSFKKRIVIYEKKIIAMFYSNKSLELHELFEHARDSVKVYCCLR